MTPVERVRSALEQVGSKKQGATNWTCPAHDDHQASLSLSRGRDDRALVRCHAGCELDAILDALGLAKSDLFPERPAKAEIVATYDYTDEHGSLLFQVVRFEPKQFRQRRPDGRGGWTWNLKGIRRVLFQLPKVLDAKAGDLPIYLVEGEKDALALQRAGVVATCNPMGAGKWRREYDATLAGATVIVVRDRDEAGAAHASQLAASLARAGCDVTVVEAAKGKDATDHFAAGLTVADFLPVAEHSDEPTVGDLIATLQSYLHLDDQGYVWFSLAVAVSGYAFDGEPLWGMLVGPSSSGKTEAIRMLGNVAGFIDDLTASALMSWTKGKDPQPTGVLYRVPDPGVVTIGDFSTVLATSNKGAKDQLFAMLRRVYDGAVTRDLGTAKKQLRWHGRLTILAACTPIIDEFASHADSLGPRWLYYRLPSRSTEAKRLQARAARIPATEGRNRAAAQTEALIAGAVERAKGLGDVPDRIADFLHDIAIVCCYGRAAVPRSGYGRREITGLATAEEPARLNKQLTQLVRALLALGASTERAVTIARRCALDSIPQTRRRCLELLATGLEMSVSELAREIGCDRKVARFALEELAAAGVMNWPDNYDADEDGTARDENRWAPRNWKLDGPDTDLITWVIGASIDSILAGQPWDEKVDGVWGKGERERAREAEHARATTSSSQGPPPVMEPLDEPEGDLDSLFKPPEDPRRHTR
jgi:5S rRNA maturation endonuclease (ribonuclease M5)